MFFAGSAVKYFTSDLIHEIHPMPPYGKIESNFFYKFLSEVNQKLDRWDFYSGKENDWCMKFSYIVTIFLNNCRLVHRNKSSNEEDCLY